MLAYGKLDRSIMAQGYFQACLGFEFSGATKADGRPVMGIAKRALATQVSVLDNLVRSPALLYQHFRNGSVPSLMWHFCYAHAEACARSGRLAASAGEVCGSVQRKAPVQQLQLLPSRCAGTWRAQ